MTPRPLRCRRADDDQRHRLDGDHRQAADHVIAGGGVDDDRRNNQNRGEHVLIFESARTFRADFHGVTHLERASARSKADDRDRVEPHRRRRCAESATPGGE